MNSQVFFLLLFLVSMVACKKKTSTTNPPATTEFTFKVDGTAIKVDSAKATLYTLGIAPFGRMIDVYAFKGGIEVLEFHFRPITGTSVADGTFSNSWLTYKAGNVFPDDYYHSSSGTLKISLCDTLTKKIEGTFDFIGSNGTGTKNITEGILKVDITQVQ
ncbi:MAG: hypothetical protein IPJ31_14790 [Bacteroidetes bacterium]|nr:hypothetical protein [Bacteroidota bacterium]MBP6315054.1 hypothetical protein [Chitinophagaceae bacterium]